MENASTLKETEAPSVEVPLEYQVFSLAMQEPGAITRFARDLQPEEVGAIHGNRGLFEFYQAMLSFYDKTGLDPIDPIAFRSWLESESDLYEALGGSAGFSIFIDLVLNQELSTPDAVIKTLQLRANKRRQMDALQMLQTLVTSKTIKSDKDIERISTLTEEIRALESQLDYDPMASMTTAADISANADALMNIPDFLPTQYLQLNKALGYTEEGGFFRGAVHAVVAASGKGKSTFTKCLCNHWADMGLTTLFVNFEEAPSHWERILMSQIIGKNVYAYADQWTYDEKVAYLKTFRDRLASWGDRFLVRHDPDSSYYDDLELWLRDIMGHGVRVPDVVVIDTIQSLLTRGSGGKPRWAEFEQIMIRLEKLARDMGSVFIITAQQNTNQAKEKREVIEQYDVGGSISIVQKCAVVMVLTEQKFLSGDGSEEDELMQVQIPKNRITGNTFIYDPPVLRYDDDSKSYNEIPQVPDEIYDNGNLAEEILGEFSI